MASWLTELDAEKARLEAKFPGWQVWFVPHNDRTITWCARPNPLINSDSPEQLRADIIAAHEACSDWAALASRADYAASAPGVPQARTR